jgi:hypothetical protein
MVVVEDGRSLSGLFILVDQINLNLPKLHPRTFASARR